MDVAKIGEEFVKVFYGLFDGGRNIEPYRQQLKDLYHPMALVTFEDHQSQGPDAIMQKFSTLPVNTVVRTLTKVDTQPTYDGKIFVVAIGMLKTDDDKPLPFLDTFCLCNVDQRYFIMNQIFRLCLHNVITS